MDMRSELKSGGDVAILHSPSSIRRSGFTLIEMLVVIVIIVILMGVVFRLSRAAIDKGVDAKETARVALFKALIEEFHAEYGIYPPVPNYSKKDGSPWQPIDFTGPFPDSKEDLILYCGDNDHIFQFGLFSFFVNRNVAGQQTFINEIGGRELPAVREAWEAYNKPVPYGGGLYAISKRDEAFVERVKPILRRLTGKKDNEEPFTAGFDYDSEGVSQGFKFGVYDARGRGGAYVYISEPPYTSYLFFNTGKDGEYYRDAPGDRTQKSNQDNIYADMEDK
jgi:prepilin-type N-terminal cleavage/methylation domain-containing protein